MGQTQRLDTAALAAVNTSSRLARHADPPFEGTRHINYYTIGQLDGLQVGSRMPLCVLGDDMANNEVYVNRLARRPVTPHKLPSAHTGRTRR